MLQSNINESAQNNSNFRQVLYTGPHSQLVLMSLLPGEDIGEEVHQGTDQILVIVSGQGQAVLNDETKDIAPQSLVFVPAGTKHNIKNTGIGSMKLYTIYAPPEHKDGTIHAAKADALKEKH
jgi:mannose-6-phosphate isomerase-like protein (cupin superfamily)